MRMYVPFDPLVACFRARSVDSVRIIYTLGLLFLQAMYPDTAGSPPPLLRPVIVLVVRNSIRGLDNKSQVCSLPIVQYVDLFATTIVFVARAYCLWITFIIGDNLEG